MAAAQASGNSYVAALRTSASECQLLVRVDASSRGSAPIVDASPRIALPVALHAMHQLRVRASGSDAQRQPTCTAVVLEDGTVGAAAWKEVSIRPAASSAAGAPVHSKRARPAAAASHGAYLAVASQAAAGAAASIAFYAAKSADQLVHMCSCAAKAPTASCGVAALSLSVGAVVVSWSDGSITAVHVDYQHSSSSSATVSSTVYIAPGTFLLGDAAAVQPTANGGTPSAKGRKRKAGEAGATASAAAALIAHAVDDGAVLLARVAADASSSGGSCSLHYAVVDSRYGCTLAAGSAPLELHSGALSAGCAARQLLQLASGQLLLLAGGCLFLLHLDLPQADLASLVGRMAVGRSGNESASTSPATTAAVVASVSVQGGSQAGSGAAAAALPAVLPQAQLNLAALLPAAQQQEGGQPDAQQASSASCELEELPRGAGGPASTSGAGAAVEAAAQRAQELLEQTEPPASAQALQQAASKLAAVLRSAGGAAMLSPPLLGRLAGALAEAGQWPQLEALLQAQPLQSLAHCPGLLPALSAAQQHALVALVCVSAQDVPAVALVAVLQRGLQPPASTEARAAQQHHCQHVRGAAEAAVREAEAATAAAAQGAAPPEAAAAALAAARRAACTVDGFTPRELCVHALLAADADLVDAGAQLRRLSGPQVLALLRYLAKWTAAYGAQPPAAVALPGGAVLATPPLALLAPTFMQVRGSWGPRL